MRVLPVIDIQGGLVVRGVAGRRHAYRPIESCLCADARPTTVARAYREQLALTEAYVADLDAISGAVPAWETYHALSDCGLQLWVDAGIADVSRARALAEFSANGTALGAVIAGLESVPSPNVLAELLSVVGDERLVFSLDLLDARPRTSAPSWSGLSANAIADAAANLGLQRIIVLDLARVGVGPGPGTEPLCRHVKRMRPSIELTAGGGVCGPADLAVLAECGCDRALVASALHDRRLGAEQLAAYR